MTHTYIINVTAPMNNISNKIVSYNKYPIICISKKSTSEIFENPQVQKSIDDTLKLIGTDLFEHTSIHVRVIDGRSNVSDYEYPIKEIISLWR